MDEVIYPTQYAVPIKTKSGFELIEMTVLATAVAGLCYFGYFQLAPWIWEQNLPFRPEDMMSWVLLWLEERDGIELYALYVLMFLNLFFLYTLSNGWHRLVGKSVRYLFVLPWVVVSCFFIGSIGFHPPMSTFADHAAPEILTQSYRAMLEILPIIALLYYLQQHSARWTLMIVAAGLIPVCFISTSSFSLLDFGYIFAPALRLFYGAGVSEVYFQYDLLLSLIGLAWMKLRLDLNLFQVVGQCAYYLLLLGLFAFSRRWFSDKRLPVFLLVAMVLVRLYTQPSDAAQTFQVTPLRLDLWLILLMLVYFKGVYHWSTGLFCGLMLLLHQNFGLIYSAAYIQLLLTLCVMDAVVLPGKPIQTVATALTTFVKNNYRNLVLILIGALAHYLLFRNPNVQNDFYYTRLGIGFMKIAANSFYWYMVVVFGMSFVLLFRLRSMVSRNYLASGFCLIYLAIGNSLYFFGRSHENNIINISVILLLLFFLMIDLGGRFLGSACNELAKPFISRNFTIIASLVFITAISIWYGVSITGKATLQVRNASKGQFIYPSWVRTQDVLNVIADVKSVTGNNPKVHFVSDSDFLLNYYGGYVPVGYYHPTYAWISRHELSRFLQGLVDQGYYLVVDNAFAKEVLSAIKISNFRYLNGCVVAWK